MSSKQLYDETQQEMSPIINYSEVKVADKLNLSDIIKSTGTTTTIAAVNNDIIFRPNGMSNSSPQYYFRTDGSLVIDTSTGSSIKFRTRTNDYTSYITAYDKATYGHNLVINSGGNTIIGSGESAANLYSNNVNGASDESENLHLAADGTLYLYSNTNTIANRKTITFNTSGILTIPGGVSFSDSYAYIQWKESGYGDKFRIIPEFSGANDENKLRIQGTVGGAGEDPTTWADLLTVSAKSGIINTCVQSATVTASKNNISFTIYFRRSGNVVTAAVTMSIPKTVTSGANWIQLENLMPSWSKTSDNDVKSLDSMIAFGSTSSDNEKIAFGDMGRISLSRASSSDYRLMYVYNQASNTTYPDGHTLTFNLKYIVK